MGIILDKLQAIYIYIIYQVAWFIFIKTIKSFIDFKNTFCTWFGFFKFLASLLHNDENHLQSSRVTLWWAWLSAMIQSICWHRYICLMYPHSNYHQYNLHLGHHHYDARKGGSYYHHYHLHLHHHHHHHGVVKGGAPDYQLVYFFWEKGKVYLLTKWRENTCYQAL